MHIAKHKAFEYPRVTETPWPGHKPSKTRQVNTLMLPAVAVAVGFVASVAQICQGIQSIFSAVDSIGQPNAASARAESQINNTIAQFKKLVADCSNCAELDAAALQIEQLLGSVSSPALCQRLAFVLREALCRSEQNLLRQEANAATKAHRTEVTSLQGQLKEAQDAYTRAVDSGDAKAAQRCAELVSRGEQQVARMRQEFESAAQSARSNIEELGARQEKLKQERESLEQLNGLSAALFVDEFNKRSSSCSKTASRLSNGRSTLSTPKISGKKP